MKVMLLLVNKLRCLEHKGFLCTESGFIHFLQQMMLIGLLYIQYHPKINTIFKSRIFTSFHQFIFDNTKLKKFLKYGRLP